MGLPLCTVSCSDLETPLPILDTQQQAQLAGLHSLTEQLSSSLNSVRHNWQAPSDSSSQQQFLENLQRLIQQLEQGSGEQADHSRQEAGEEGMSWARALLSLQGPSGLGSILGNATYFWSSEQ